MRNLTRVAHVAAWLVVYAVALVAIVALLVWGGWRFVAGVVAGVAVLGYGYWEVVLKGRGPRGIR